MNGTYEVDADQILKDAALPPIAIRVDGASREVRELLVADVRALAEMTKPGQVTIDEGQKMDQMRGAVAGFFADPRPDTSQWDAVKLQLISGLVLEDWKRRAEKNSASISAAIVAEMEKRFGMPGDSTQQFSPSLQL
jgi:hypothetical protein